MKNQLYSLLLTTLFVTGFHFADFQEDEVRQLESFDKVDVSGGIKLYLEQGSKHTADVEVENAELDDLITKVKGGELQIYFKKNLLSSWKNRQATVVVTYKDLTALDISSGCYVESNTTITASDFDLSCSSGTRVILDLDVDDLDAKFSSGTSVTLEGSADNLDVRASSGCAVNASELKSIHVVAEAKSGTSMKVWAIESIDAEAKSGSSIKYKGDPNTKDISSGYSGSISNMR